MIAAIGTPNSASEGNSRTISSVSPLCERISIRSSRCTRPRSPWTASAGWRQWLGVPVEASVAMIFWPTSPALPIPQTMHVPPALEEQLHGPAKLAVQPVGHLGQGTAFGQNHLPGEAELLERAQRARGSGGFRAHRLVNP